MIDAYSVAKIRQLRLRDLFVFRRTTDKYVGRVDVYRQISTFLRLVVPKAESILTGVNVAIAVEYLQCFQCFLRNEFQLRAS